MSSSTKLGWVLGAIILLGAPRLDAQERGANALGESVLGLGVNTRVLMIGAHPDDEDTNLIAWLSRGRHVETAYLSLTRGDGGQNVIGNELGAALGVIRTEELLAARRIDGARQYFTRAFDFGFTKDTVDTYAHWQRDSILGDVVRVVRAFRPHVIVAVFSGTPRDGHGQHQVSGLLAREAFDVAGDTVRFPTREYNAAWTPLKFYRAQRGNADGATLSLDAGEYSSLLGRSYAEIAGESRSQHKSQGFGALERKGPVMNYLRREATRVNEGTPPVNERSLFDGIDTTWNRFRRSVTHPPALAALDSLSGAFADVRRAFDPLVPANALPGIARIQRFLLAICSDPESRACYRVVERGDARDVVVVDPDLATSVENAFDRANDAARLASGVTMEATASREVFSVGAQVAVHVALYNRGLDTVAVVDGRVIGWGDRPDDVSPPRLIPPGGILRDTLSVRMDSAGRPWWMAAGRTGAMFNLPASARDEATHGSAPSASYQLDLGGRRSGAIANLVERVTFRFADDVEGEINRPIVAAPLLTVTLPTTVQYAPANVAINRTLEVTVRSASDAARTASVSLVLPAGLTADTARRAVRLERGGSSVVRFRIRGRLRPGQHRIVARAESDGRTYESGYDLIDYDHIRRRRVYRPAAATIAAIDVRIPARLRVAYIPGVSDNVAPALQQLGVPVTVIDPATVARTDLSAYTTVVVGPRAYEAHPQLVAANTRLLDFARRGGTLVVQYGQYEMTNPGIMPYAVTINRPHDRVTHEEAPVTILQPRNRALTTPNAITAADFNGWVQERSLYMPRTFATQYTPLLAMSDPGEPARNGALLVSRLGRGYYVYTSLAFFRQLPAGVPGAARLFVNLMSLTPPPPARR